MELLSLLTDKCFSERGYSGAGRLIHRVLSTLVGVYPLNARFVNTDEWDSESMSLCLYASFGQLTEITTTQVSTRITTRTGEDSIRLRTSRLSGTVG